MKVHLWKCLEAGRGCPRNLTEAAAWMRTAADGGCADSATRLGVCYLHGNGVKLDQVQAAAWLTQGSQDGAANPFATFSLGQMHENGHGGFACNPCRALDFYAKAVRGALRLAHVGGDMAKLLAEAQKHEARLRPACDPLLGAHVALQNLATAPALNGRSGVVQSLKLTGPAAEEAVYTVRVDHSVEDLLLRRGNLLPEPPTPHPWHEHALRRKTFKVGQFSCSGVPDAPGAGLASSKSSCRGPGFFAGGLRHRCTAGCLFDLCGACFQAGLDVDAAERAEAAGARAKAAEKRRQAPSEATAL